MRFSEAVSTCHIRSGIYRVGDPVKIFTHTDLKNLHTSLQNLHEERVGSEVMKVYWKNNKLSLYDRVPKHDQIFNDWEEYDPREQDGCSAFNEIPA
jgi:hypothetical protein